MSKMQFGFICGTVFSLLSYILVLADLVWVLLILAIPLSLLMAYLDNKDARRQ